MSAYPRHVGKTARQPLQGTAARRNTGTSGATVPLLNAANTWSGTQTMSAKPLELAEGAAVASAATTDIWTPADGNTVHVTGTTTITSFGTAPQAGAFRWVIFDGALTLTHGANLSLPGSTNITTAADDIAYVYADTTTQFDVLYFKKSGVATVVSASGFTLGTEQATTSGTTVDFTGIPAGTKMIVVSLVGFSTNGTTAIIIQLGDAGGIETTGYTSAATRLENAAGVVAGASTAGFSLAASQGAGNTYHGLAVLSLENSSAFTWAYNSNLGDSGGLVYNGGGTKSLSAELTQLRLTTASANTFDAGAVNITYIG